MVRNRQESNFQSFIIIIFPHSSHSLPFRSTSKHSNQTVQLCFVHLPGRDMQADCLTANTSGSTYHQLFKMSKNHLFFYIYIYVSQKSPYIYADLLIYHYHDTHSLLWTRDSSARKDTVRRNFLQSLKWNIRFLSFISKWLGSKSKLSILALVREDGRLWHSLFQAVNVRMMRLKVLSVSDPLGRCQHYLDLAGIQCTQHLCIYTSTKLIYCMSATFDRYMLRSRNVNKIKSCYPAECQIGKFAHAFHCYLKYT